MRPKPPHQVNRPLRSPGYVRQGRPQRFPHIPIIFPSPLQLPSHHTFPKCFYINASTIKREATARVNGTGSIERSLTKVARRGRGNISKMSLNRILYILPPAIRRKAIARARCENPFRSFLYPRQMRTQARYIYYRTREASSQDPWDHKRTRRPRLARGASGCP